MTSQPAAATTQQQQRENIIFSDRFVVTDVNKEGHKFDRVSRIHATSENGDAELVLDYNSEIYSLKPQAVFMLVLVQSLSTMYTPQLPASELKSQKILDNWRDKQTTKTLADEYDYVMHGKVYKIDDDGNHRL